MSEEFYHNEDSVKQYIKAAEGHSGTALIEKLKEYLPTDAQLLELGSGPGTDWKILSESYSVTGSDNSLEFLKYLETHFPKGNFIELDATSIATDNLFDGIYSNKVLHHLSDDDLKFSIQKQSEILLPKGIVCHSFWGGEGTEVFNGLFVNYHSIDEIKELFGKQFEILLIEKYKEFDDDDSILVIGRKK